ncbi:hypothetical protein [Kurthia sibirica]|uniref:hypothetical protein n=1 Tax=Kurthia sibirica TaxID=202750 RepID=UPI0011B28E04|nr:hypothetical protein [Kurthia sibirica]
MKVGGLFIIVLLLTFFNLKIENVQAKEKINTVPLYKDTNAIGITGTKKEVHKKAMKKYKTHMDIVEKYYKKQNIIVSNNLDDVLYQDRVNNLALELDYFTKSNSKKVKELVNFIGYYSNFDTNARIKILNKKLKNGTITNDEKNELESYRPVDTNSTKKGNTQITTVSKSKNGYDSGKAVICYKMD